MWADQISAAGGLKETATGYQMDDSIPFTDEPVTGDIDVAPTQDTAEPLTEVSEAPVDGTAPAQDTVLGETRPQATLSPDGSAAVVAGTQVDDTPVAFPMSDSGPVTFPGSTSDEAASQKDPSVTQTPGITFAQEVGTPERTGTPDPESETKRKRISSQNFQRLARRISVTTRRAGSVSVSGIPILGNLRRDATSASASGSAQASTETDAPKLSSESPAGSIQSEPDKDKTKKEKDKKKRRTFI
jgi:ATP-binding cassette subfamily B (MDR/TAP) protein 6